MTRLDSGGLDALPEGVARPGYDPAAHGTGIVHLGCGAFHRAHQAAYTDAALARSGGDWRIAAVSLRSREIADALNQQDGLYTLIERGGDGINARVIGSLSRVIAATRETDETLAALTDPATKIVMLTVTEKAYGIDRASSDVDAAHPAVAADLADPRRPTGALGFIVEALRLRFDAKRLPFTVLCCDNLPDNGALVKAGVLGFARRVDPTLAARIEETVAFPSSMVDRITPAARSKTLADAERLTGYRDEAAVETEPFTQWVIEDDFPQGRPDWEAGGALFVADVAPYEAMKLRMLNGAHSMVAYAGFLAGHVFVRDAMADASLARLVRRHLLAASATLNELPGIDLETYADELVARFANSAIAHATYQIAMDGTEKLPQRLVAPALDTLSAGRSARSFAFAIAAWMRYCLGRTEDGVAYVLRDPREAAIGAAVAAAAGDPVALAARLFALDEVFSSRLVESRAFTTQVTRLLSNMVEKGMRSAIDTEAQEAHS